jgi:hypothetical protein
MYGTLGLAGRGHRVCTREGRSSRDISTDSRRTPGCPSWWPASAESRWSCSTSAPSSCRGSARRDDLRDCGRRRQARPARPGRCTGVPHRVGRAVRHGHDRGDGVRHPRGGAEPRARRSTHGLYQLVHDELLLDGSARLNLATHRFWTPTSSGTSGCRGSRRSTRRGTSTDWSTRERAGRCGVRPPRCPKNSCSPSTTSAARCAPSR